MHKTVTPPDDWLLAAKYKTPTSVMPRFYWGFGRFYLRFDKSGSAENRISAPTSDGLFFPGLKFLIIDTTALPPWPIQNKLNGTCVMP